MRRRKPGRCPSADEPRREDGSLTPYVSRRREVRPEDGGRRALHWVAITPNAPCHKGNSGPESADVIDMGWGMAVVYVGQQTWDRSPRPLTPRQLETLKKRAVTCSADYVDANRGSLEGVDAIQKTQAEGFPKGSVIFLDIERMERMPQRMRDYYKSWVADGAHGTGAISTGIYVHKHKRRSGLPRRQGAVFGRGFQGQPRFGSRAPGILTQQSAARGGSRLCGDVAGRDRRRAQSADGPLRSTST